MILILKKCDGTKEYCKMCTIKCQEALVCLGVTSGQGAVKGRREVIEKMWALKQGLGYIQCSGEEMTERPWEKF